MRRIQLLKGLVEVRNVRLMMLLMVKLHDLSTDERFKLVVVVGQIGQGVGVSGSLRLLQGL